LTEDEAKEWLASALNVSRETLLAMERFRQLLIQEQDRQNLVSTRSLESFWSRHVVDSAQLVPLAPTGTWLDIGSGAGLPGIITALLTRAPTLLVEPRARRAQFLNEVAETLGLTRAQVFALPVEKLVPQPVDIITARAVAPLNKLVAMGAPFAHEQTVWLLPKGKSAQSELASLSAAWQGSWALHRSVTDPESQILVGRHIRMNGKR
jgi:16S rRNA (guanine527-N7)-methyltransferase